jgi:hypothetical protein
MACFGLCKQKQLRHNPMSDIFHVTLSYETHSAACNAAYVWLYARCIEIWQTSNLEENDKSAETPRT